MPAASSARVSAVRRFNRFYTRQIGVLRKGYLDSPFSLAEARVLYELFTHPSLTASDIAASLDLDAGYLSRVLAAFEKRGLIVAQRVKAGCAPEPHQTDRTRQAGLCPAGKTLTNPRGSDAGEPRWRRTERAWSAR